MQYLGRSPNLIVLSGHGGGSGNTSLKSNGFTRLTINLLTVRMIIHFLLWNVRNRVCKKTRWLHLEDGMVWCVL